MKSKHKLYFLFIIYKFFYYIINQKTTHIKNFNNLYNFIYEAIKNYDVNINFYFFYHNDYNISGLK